MALSPLAYAMSQHPEAAAAREMGRIISVEAVERRGIERTEEACRREAEDWHKAGRTVISSENAKAAEARAQGAYLQYKAKMIMRRAESAAQGPIGPDVRRAARPGKESESLPSRQPHMALSKSTRKCAARRSACADNADADLLVRLALEMEEGAQRRGMNIAQVADFYGLRTAMVKEQRAIATMEFVALGEADARARIERDRANFFEIMTGMPAGELHIVSIRCGEGRWYMKYLCRTFPPATIRLREPGGRTATAMEIRPGLMEIHTTHRDREGKPVLYGLLDSLDEGLRVVVHARPDITSIADYVDFPICVGRVGSAQRIMAVICTGLPNASRVGQMYGRIISTGRPCIGHDCDVQAVYGAVAGRWIVGNRCRIGNIDIKQLSATAQVFGDDCIVGNVDVDKKRLGPETRLFGIRCIAGHLASLYEVAERELELSRPCMIVDKTVYLEGIAHALAGTLYVTRGDETFWYSREGALNLESVEALEAAGIPHLNGHAISGSVSVRRMAHHFYRDAPFIMGGAGICYVYRQIDQVRGVRVVERY